MQYELASLYRDRCTNAAIAEIGITSKYHCSKTQTPVKKMPSPARVKC